MKKRLLLTGLILCSMNTYAQSYYVTGEFPNQDSPSFYGIVSENQIIHLKINKTFLSPDINIALDQHEPNLLVVMPQVRTLSGIETFVSDDKQNQINLPRVEIKTCIYDFYLNDNSQKFTIKFNDYAGKNYYIKLTVVKIHTDKH